MASKKRKKAGLPPGTLIYTGKMTGGQPKVHLLQYNEELIREDFGADRLPEPKAGSLVTWYDVRGLSNIRLIEELGRRFDIHPLVLEDVLNTQQRPKLEEYPGGIFLILEAMSWDPEELMVKDEQVSLYVTKNQVISFQEDEEDLFTGIRERLHLAAGRVRQRGADYLAYALMDYIVDHYYAILDHLEDALSMVEQEILTNPEAATKGRIHRLRMCVLRLRKASGPTREAINRLYRIDHPVFREETAIFIRDLYDHLAQINDTIDNFRDIINGLYDLYLSEISSRVNSVIQVLTIVSTIFIPLTFLVGVYGMNFDYMPELHGRYSYYALWIIMFLIFVGQLIYYRKKKWL